MRHRRIEQLRREGGLQGPDTEVGQPGVDKSMALVSVTGGCDEDNRV
jgi:hypothetical protein